MASTSQKHRNFVSEPMGEKPVTELPGIGKALGDRLIEQSYDTAYSVLGQFLHFKKDESSFKGWLNDVSGANAKQQNDCYQCLKEWCNSFFMASTSQKHRNFVSEPMGEKPVTELPGIGKALGGRLKEQNYDTAYSVLGQFLHFKKDESSFKGWLNDVSGANAKQQNDCYQCLKEWCNSFL